jgi:ribosomal protein L7/L12
MKEVIDALKKGLILNAIKIYKNNSDVGLKEARDYVVNVLKPKYYKPSKTMTDFMNGVDELVKFQSQQFNK